MVDEAHHSAVIADGVSRSEGHLQCSCRCALQDSAGVIQREDTPPAINIELVARRDIRDVADFQDLHRTFPKIDPVEVHRGLVQGHQRT